MAITILESDKTVKVPYGFKGEKITIAEMIKSSEFTSLEPLFAERILEMIRDNPSIGILKGGGGRTKEQVRNLFYANYKKINDAPDYENDASKYEQIKSGKLKWNPEDSQWYRRATDRTVAVPGGSWHEGGYAVDFTGNIALAGKVSKNYQLEQITGTGETHHFQPLGVPISKRMFLELKNNYGIDAIKTPLSPDLLLYINKEIASNVPRHPQRIKKVLDAALAKFKTTLPEADDKTVREQLLTFSGQSASPTKVDWSQVREITPTTVAKAVAPKTTTTTTTTVNPTTTAAPRTTTTMAPPKTTTTTPARKNTAPPPLAPLGPPATAAPTTTVPKTKTPASYDPKTGVPLDSKGNVIPVTVPANTAPPTTTTSTTVPAAPTTVPKGATTTTTVPQKSTTTTLPVVTPPFDLEAPGAVKKQYDSAVAAKPDKNGMYNILGFGLATKAERDAIIAAYKPKASETPGVVKTPADVKTPKTNKWQTIVQQEFGSLWDVYNDNPDVKKVLDKSVQEGWYNDTTKLTAALQNTVWFRNTQSSSRKYAIRQSTDMATLEDEINEEIAKIRAESLNSGVTLADNTLKDLAEKKIKFGWTTQQVSNAVGSEAVAAAAAGGAQGMTDLRQGAIGTRLRGVADNFAQKPTDSMLDMYIAEIMKGTKTEQGFNDLMKQQASTQFRSLAPQIDKGLDVKTAVSMYSNSAQSVLGVDSATIDWSTDKWNKALNYQDPKTNEYRQMDSWEWNRYLRGLPEWQETDDAKRTYRSAAFTLAQAFGKTT